MFLIDYEGAVPVQQQVGNPVAIGKRYAHALLRTATPINYFLYFVCDVSTCYLWNKNNISTKHSIRNKGKQLNGNIVYFETMSGAWTHVWIDFDTAESVVCYSCTIRAGIKVLKWRIKLIKATEISCERPFPDQFKVPVLWNKEQTKKRSRELTSLHDVLHVQQESLFCENLKRSWQSHTYIIKKHLKKGNFCWNVCYCLLTNKFRHIWSVIASLVSSPQAAVPFASVNNT